MAQSYQKLSFESDRPQQRIQKGTNENECDNKLINSLYSQFGVFCFPMLESDRLQQRIQKRTKENVRDKNMINSLHSQFAVVFVGGTTQGSYSLYEIIIKHTCEFLWHRVIKNYRLSQIGHYNEFRKE